MKTIVCISDTHNQMKKIELPEGDLLIHSGDLTARGEVSEISRELNELSKHLKTFKNIVLVCGNHDWLGEKQPQLMEQMCKDKGITCLCDSGTEIDGIKIYGSPWQPAFCNWSYNLPRGEPLRQKWDLIPEDTQILVTHSPPYMILDQCPDGFHAGCEDLYRKVMDLPNLKMHQFGHIHHQYSTINRYGVKYVNASICTEEYKPTNSPIVTDWEELERGIPW